MSRAKRNKRRIQLLEKDIDQGLTAAERKELDVLQAKLDRSTDKKRPASRRQVQRLEAEIVRLDREAKDTQSDDQ